MAMNRKENYGEVLVGSRSFKDAVMGRSMEEKQGKVIIIDEDFKAQENGLGKAVIVGMADFIALKEASVTIRGMMQGEGVVQYVGGMFILVSFKSGDDVDKFCLLSKDKKDVFQSVEKWVGQTLPFERIAWLRIQGIPLHLIDNSVINRIGESFGKIVQAGHHEVWDSDLSYDYVGVLVSEGKRIQEEVVVQWKGRKYRVWVEEHIGDWEPDFLGKERGVDVAPVGRSQSSSPEKLPVPRSSGDLEGTIDSGVNLESSHNVLKDCMADKEGSKINGVMEVGDKETVGIFGESFLETNLLGNMKKISQKQGSKKLKKGGKKQVGHVFISVDERPKTKKRPRLDMEPNGIDPFGLDAMLGLLSGNRQEGPNSLTEEFNNEEFSEVGEIQGAAVESQVGGNVNNLDINLHSMDEGSGGCRLSEADDQVTEIRVEDAEPI
ncbi:hypothetical protein Hdeb2414_s0021g00580091 [Helianthus debilis subsp. tardiflorus]